MQAPYCLSKQYWGQSPIFPLLSMQLIGDCPLSPISWLNNPSPREFWTRRGEFLARRKGCQASTCPKIQGRSFAIVPNRDGHFQGGFGNRLNNGRIRSIWPNPSPLVIARHIKNLQVDASSEHGSQEDSASEDSHNDIGPLGFFRESLAGVYRPCLGGGRRWLRSVCPSSRHLSPGTEVPKERVGRQSVVSIEDRLFPHLSTALLPPICLPDRLHLVTDCLRFSRLS